MDSASFDPAACPPKRKPIQGASAKGTFVSQSVEPQPTPVDLLAPTEEGEVPPASVSVQCSIDGERRPQSLVCTPLQSFSTKYKQQFLRPSK